MNAGWAGYDVPMRWRTPWRAFDLAAVLSLCSAAACGRDGVHAGAPDADAGGRDGDAAASDVQPPADALSADGDTCWVAPVPPAVSSIPPRSAVADSCAVGASASTTWTYPENPFAARPDDSWRVVGRWATCGRTVPGLPAHDALELGANARWRLLAIDRGTGAFVPLSGSGALSGYYELTSGGKYGLMNVRGELPGPSLWSGQLTFAAAGDALRFANDDATVAVYARSMPSPYDGADNPSPTSDGHCSMVGSWDVPADGNTFSRMAAVFSFDAAGNFVGDPEGGGDACGNHLMGGTYALSSSAFQIVTSTGLGYCDGWYSARYTATFDASCDQVVLAPTYDECSNRAYFSKPTTLTRRPPQATGDASMPPDAGRPVPATFSADRWRSQLPPAPVPMTAPAAVADLCTAAASATDWAPVPSPPEVIEDYRGYIVGRWAACGAKIAQLPAHAGIEFGANGRWRLLATEAAKGGLVPLAAAGSTSGYYYAMSHDRSQKAGALVLIGELPSGSTWTFFVQYSGQQSQAIRFDGQLASSGEAAGPIYARAAADPDNGAGNPPPTGDGSCSMAGTWDVVATDNPLGAPPAVIAFDDLGNFVGGPAGSNLCQGAGISGTYALASGRFQLTTGLGMRPCDWWMRALYAAAFDASCNQLSVMRISDACNGYRGYFDEPTTLTRRVPLAPSR